VKALDTNVLVRFLVGDDRAQRARDARFIRTECSQDDPCFINRIVLCELVWVLESSYGYRRDRIAAALNQVLRARQLHIENLAEAWTALREYESGADFADSLIAAINRAAGCDYTATFDRRASRVPGFRVL